MISESGYIQSRKAQAIESYFRDSKFSDAPEPSIDNLILDFEICSVQQCLDPHQMSLFFVNALADPARQFFLTQCLTRMTFEHIATIMRPHYNPDTRKLHLQFEVDGLELSSSMHKHRIRDISTGLRKMVNHINALAHQLPPGFRDDAHKTRYLRRAVMRHEWAQQPISQLTTS